MNAQMMADDGFAGAGGWDLAAEALGIHARGIEIMPEARLTRDAAGLTTIHDDVWTFTPDGRAIGKIDSPPCQTFSAAGKGSGRKALDDVLSVIASGAWTSLDQLRSMGERFGDDRTALVLTPLHFATGYEYEWLAWEQVPTVLPVWEACAAVLRELGWFTWTGLLQAEMYGVPQTRKRALLLASRLGPVAPPTPTHSRYYSRSPEKLDEGVQKWVSMAEALGWVESGLVFDNGQNPARTRQRPIDEPAPTVFCSRPGNLTWVMRSNYGTGGDSTKRGERLASEPAPTVTSKIDRNLWIPPTHMGDVYNSKGCIRSTDEPAPTMTASMDNGNFRWHDREVPEWPRDRPAPTVVGSRRTSEGMLIGRQLDDDSRQDVGGHQGSKGLKKGQLSGVRVTVQEAGVLQSFPADHPWQGTKGKQYLQCGNAVPPLLAFHALGAAAVHHLGAIEAVA